MKKMNFNNQETNDDEQLIALLKQATIENPSPLFTEVTLSKFQNHRLIKPVYRPLRAPLYIMAALVIILIFPLSIPMVSDFSYRTKWYDVNNISVAALFRSTLWYWLTFLALSFLCFIINIHQQKYLRYHSSSK